jgi:hypothetical protein
MPRWPEKKSDEPVIPAAIPQPEPDPTLVPATPEDMVLTPARETYWGPRVEPLPQHKKVRK